MNKDLFWEIIDSVNKSFAGMDRESRRCQVVEKLLKLSLEEILDWDLILMEYSNAACRNDLLPFLADLPRERGLHERHAGPGLAGRRPPGGRKPQL